MEDNPQDNLLSVSQASELKGVSRAAIYSAIARGRLRHQRVLGHIGVRRADVLAWMPVGYKGGRPKGTPMSDEAKARLSQSQKRRWARQRQASSES